MSEEQKPPSPEPPDELAPSEPREFLEPLEKSLTRTVPTPHTRQPPTPQPEPPGDEGAEESGS